MVTVKLGHNPDGRPESRRPDSTTFKVGPAGDINAFAKRLNFLKVRSVDAKSRTITAELRR